MHIHFALALPVFMENVFDGEHLLDGGAVSPNNILQETVREPQPLAPVTRLVNCRVYALASS